MFISKFNIFHKIISIIIYSIIIIILHDIFKKSLSYHSIYHKTTQSPHHTHHTYTQHITTHLPHHTHHTYIQHITTHPPHYRCKQSGMTISIRITVSDFSKTQYFIDNGASDPRSDVCPYLAILV